MHPFSWQQLIAPALFLFILVAMFYSIVIRPTQARAKKHQELLDSLKPGDRIVTAGGIYGKITEVRERTVGLEIARGITVTLDRRAVRRRQTELEDEP